MVKRGDIYYADLSPVVGSEQGGMRPVLIIQNNTGNKHSPTVIAAAITSQTGKARLPTHIELAARSVGLNRDSVILLEQIRQAGYRHHERRGQCSGGELRPDKLMLWLFGNIIGSPEHKIAQEIFCGGGYGISTLYRR